MNWNPFSKKKTIPTLAPSRPKSIRKIRIYGREFDDFRQKSAYTAFSPEVLEDKASFQKTFYDFVSRYVPQASFAVWVWENMCNGPISIGYQGHGSALSKRRADKILSDMNKRISPINTIKNSGFNSIASFYLNSLFKYGRFASKILVSKEIDYIDHLKVINPFTVKFSQDLVPFVENGNVLYSVNSNIFYFYSLSMSVDNPYGNSMFDSCPTFIQLSNDIFEYMRIASLNVGVPRLHIKIKQPQILDMETVEDYSARAKAYFDDSVSQFSEIAPEDNFYSWADTEIGVVGDKQSVGASGTIWKVNSQLISEELISGFHLYPWLLSKSYGTSREWVGSQYDILMGEVDTIQLELCRFLEWISSIELLLNGITDITPKITISRPRDPSSKTHAETEALKTDTVIKKLNANLITPEQAIRELSVK